MRTTISLDDDVLHAVKERGEREGRTAGEVLSGLARQALTAGTGATAGGRHGFSPLPHRGPVVTNAVIDRLREDEPE